ncbi:hypothetical protein BGZ61DRAFT_84622 [Ilyonectria robusta]|uniref:uncharacterized protein n=1 Tax=Ilyonectria robusta TaxID=1079257 RepID=UPI001E8E73DE|nr:uncharacterized protein BGZ61DRAFT_84622 [Ilyonectria robusta]KAH8735731.1 hypothetical protein BGZ61DRAFT_84622 [Ilyonectria robusta]
MALVPIGVAQARRLVESIADENGYVPDEIWQGVSSQYSKERLQRVIKELNGGVLPEVAALAKSLYTSNTRFIFEILQNAEDSHFTKARDRGERPSIAFEVYEDRIIIDCNEDGFTPENLKAICDINGSCKTGLTRYFGEKGIGFRSLFMAAWKVHIQSGDYSFHFKHKPGDSGLGMISPTWQEPEVQLPHPLTRMTLLLHDPTEGEPFVMKQDAIHQQFSDIPEIALLFMRNIREIRISIFDSQEKVQKSTVFSATWTGSDRATLTKSVTEGGDTMTTSKIYHITRHMAESKTRSPSELERSEGHAAVEVVLGFPLSTTSQPIVEPQDVFTSLPIGHMGFSFLIHSDFVTEGNPHDIAKTSVRNLEILDVIADAFCRAVWQFCCSAGLPYTWMRYLPNKDTFEYDGFWSKLVTAIENKIAALAVLRPQSGGPWRQVNKLRPLPPIFLDCHGDPLFRDLALDIYLSTDYKPEDADILVKFGMARLCWTEVLDRVQNDLSAVGSRMWGNKTSENWHTKAAELLLILFKGPEHKFLRERVRKMRLLPLASGLSRAQNDEGEVYFSEVEGVPIPSSLPLDLIKYSAMANSRRSELFKHLGVCTTDVNTVRQLILQKQRDALSRAGTFFSGNAKELQFLYKTHRFSSSTMDSNIVFGLANQEFKCFSAHVRDMYIPDDCPLGPQELLKKTDAGNEYGQNAPGMTVDFVHSSYFSDIPNKPHPTSLSWQAWLCRYAGARRYLRLATRSGPCDLSEACYYIAKYRPEKFLGFLRTHWPSGGSPIELSPELQGKLGGVRVLCEDDDIVPLSATYLPLPDLEEQRARFLKEEEPFPFLKLDGPVERGTYAKEWGFLERCLGVGVNPDMVFYLTILCQICNGDVVKETDGSRIIELYTVLLRKLEQSASRTVEQEYLQNVFANHSRGYVPPQGNQEPQWGDPRQCLWDAPPTMESKYPLKRRYEEMLADGPNDLQAITTLFTEVLRVPNCTWYNMVDELKYLKEQRCEDLARIRDIYVHLHGMATNLNDSDKYLLRNTFATDALIYVEQNEYKGWHRVPDCVWSSETEIQGKKISGSHYANLQEFFVDILGTETLSIELACDELVRLGSSTSSVEQVKQQIWALNSFLANSDRYLANVRLIRSRIFPVRHPDGRIELTTMKTNFAIIDRTHLEDFFATRVKSLDFTLDETHRLRPFLLWLGLEGRFLSNLVKELTSFKGSAKWHVSSPEYTIPPRAHALYRVAAHFNSPRLEHDGNLYDVLRRIQIYEVDRITSEFYLSQDGETYTHERIRSDLHFDDRTVPPDIFIPHNKEDRAFCFTSKLPRRLFEWMMTDPITGNRTIDEKGIRITTNILNSSRHLISKILDEEGIVSVEAEDEYWEDQEISEVESQIEPIFDAADRIYQSHPEPMTPSTSGPRRNPDLSESTVAADVETVENQALMGQVFQAARGARFPSPSIYDMLGMQDALPSVDDREFSYDGLEGPIRHSDTSQLERNKVIGAAGELYVFELLKSLEPALPALSTANWQSTIRNYAAVLPDYADIQPAQGREASDITYHDTEGAFTRLLINRGYLGSRWEARTPTYFVQVKTTTGPCNTPFYMSKSQYKRMYDHHGSGGKEIYVIFRVFNVDKQSVGLKIYMDPVLLEGSLSQSRF